MAWDTDETRRRLLDAGARQFAAHGFAGARMDRIEADAGVNRERVYRYFGNKQGFFSAVLERELAGLLDGLVIDGEGPEALGRFADAMFARCDERPQLPRLLAWESLELGHAVALENRRPICRACVREVVDALSPLAEAEAEDLLLSVITLVVGAWTLTGVAESVLGDAEHSARRSAAVVRHAIALARQA